MGSILLIPGLCCTSAVTLPLEVALRDKLGSQYDVQCVDKEDCDKYSVAGYLNSIVERYRITNDTIVVGHSLGGAFALLLAAKRYTKKVILINPAATCDWWQIDPLRATIYGKQLVTNKAFKFDRKTLQKYILNGVEQAQIDELLPTFYNEPASLIREFAYGSKDNKLGNEGSRLITQECSGLVIVGGKDRICPVHRQIEIANKFEFDRIVFEDSGHSPFLDHNKEKVFSAIFEFILGNKDHTNESLDRVS